MTKQEQLKILSAYLPYELDFIYNRDIPCKSEAWKLVGLCERLSSENDFVARATRKDYKNQINTTISLIKPILYSMTELTKEELHEADFGGYVDFVTNERDVWIGKYGFEGFLNRVPNGIVQWLISKHYNIFNLPENAYIKKETLKL